MKVLLINNCHYRRGGSESVYFNTAKLLKAHGHEVVYLSYYDKGNEQTDDKEYLIEWGGSIKKITHYFYNIDSASMIELIIENERPDIAHVHLLWGGIGVSIFSALRKHNIPLVHTVHDYRMICPAYTFKNNNSICENCKRWNFYQCTLKRCNKGSLVQSAIMTLEMYFRQLFFNPINNIDGFLFVSKFAKQKHIEHCPEFASVDHDVLYNFTKPMLPRDAKVKEDYYLFFGRLSYEKGIKTLIEAFAKTPSIKLKIVGTGPLESELKNLCSKYKLDNIEFLGYKSGDSLCKLIQKAKFVCVPSEWYENNPMTILESYSLGTPVIGANIGGIPEIILEGVTGFTFESSNLESLIGIINYTCELDVDKYLELCESSYSFYEKNFTEEVYYTRLMEFYNKVRTKLTNNIL